MTCAWRGGAYEVGHYEYQARRNGELTSKGYGKHTLVWRRVGDEWKIAVDQWSPRPHPEAEEDETFAR